MLCGVSNEITACQQYSSIPFSSACYIGVISHVFNKPRLPHLQFEKPTGLSRTQAKRRSSFLPFLVCKNKLFYKSFKTNKAQQCAISSILNKHFYHMYLQNRRVQNMSPSHSIAKFVILLVSEKNADENQPVISVLISQKQNLQYCN